jgi:hypothetical protein
MRIVVLPDHVAPPFAMYTVAPPQRRVTVDLTSARTIVSPSASVSPNFAGVAGPPAARVIVTEPFTSTTRTLAAGCEQTPSTHVPPTGQHT